MFKGVSAQRKNLRCESNRVIIAEKNDLPKSIFNIGQYRHNVMSKDDIASKIVGKITDKPVRLLEWKEETMKQKFDKKIAFKIGQNY